jgi:quercetin dioxygenase-like cupin family protein
MKERNNLKAVKGNFLKEQSRNGWIYGSFMPEGLQKDDRVEVKITKWKKGSENTPHFQKTATKIDIMFEGKGVWEIDGQDVELNSGDYVIVPPKVVTRIKSVLTDEILVQTIKVPSDPADKVQQ